MKTAKIIKCLREISQRLKELDLPQETLKELNEWIDVEERTIERFEEFKEFCRSMETWQARIIRVLRVEEKRNWRAIAKYCYKLGWGKWIPPSNQIMGYALCERAAQLLGENYEEEPWN